MSGIDRRDRSLEATVKCVETKSAEGVSLRSALATQSWRRPRLVNPLRSDSSPIGAAKLGEHEHKKTVARS